MSVYIHIYIYIYIYIYTYVEASSNSKVSSAVLEDFRVTLNWN